MLEMNNKTNYQTLKSQNGRAKLKKGRNTLKYEYTHQYIPDKMVPIGIHCRLKWKHKARQCLKGGMLWLLPFYLFFIRPKSDHIGIACQLLTDSLTDWLTHCRLVNLIDVTLACEDAYSKLVEVVTVADISDENCVGNSLFQIWKLRS